MFGNERENVWVLYGRYPRVMRFEENEALEKCILCSQAEFKTGNEWKDIYDIQHLEPRHREKC